MQRTTFTTPDQRPLETTKRPANQDDGYLPDSNKVRPPSRRRVTAESLKSMLDAATDKLSQSTLNETDLSEILPIIKSNREEFYKISDRINKGLIEKLFETDWKLARFFNLSCITKPMLESMRRRAPSEHVWFHPALRHEAAYVIQYQHFNVAIEGLRGIDKLSQQQIIAALPNLPCEIACAFMAARSVSLNLRGNENALRCLFAEVSKAICDWSLGEQLRLKSNLFYLLSHVEKTSDIQTLAREKLATTFFENRKSLVVIPDPNRYVDWIKGWFLSTHEIPVYESDSLYKPDHLCTLFSEENTVLFLRKADFGFHGPGFTRLIDDGYWDDGNGNTGIIKARLVVVVSNERDLTEETPNRLARHLDSYICYSSWYIKPEKPHTRQSTESTPKKFIQEAKFRWMKQYVKVSHSRQTLLKQHFILPEQLHHGPGHLPSTQVGLPLLFNSKEEAWMLRQEIPKGSTCIVPVQYSMGDASIMRSLPEGKLPNSMLVLLPGLVDIDLLISHYLSKSDHSDTAERLLHTDVLVNSLCEPSVYGIVYEDRGTPCLNYKGQHFPVKSLQRANVFPDLEEIRSKGLAVLKDENRKTALITQYKDRSDYTRTQACDMVLGSVMNFLTNDDPLLLLEGETGIGKDYLTQTLLELISDQVDNTLYHIHTGDPDTQPHEIALTLRTKHPDKTLIMHFPEINAFPETAWSSYLLFVMQDADIQGANIKTIGTCNPSDTYKGRFRLPLEWPRIQLPKYSNEELLKISRAMFRKYARRDKILNEFLFSQAVNIFHCLVMKKAKKHVTLRQLDRFIKALIDVSDGGIKGFNPRTQFSIVYQHYRSSFNKKTFGCNDLDCIKDRLAKAVDGKASTLSHTYRSTAEVLKNPSYFKHHADRKTPSSPWHGDHSSYLSDRVKDFTVPKYVSDVYKYKTTNFSDSLQPGDSIELLGFPGQEVFLIPFKGNNPAKKKDALIIKPVGKGENVYYRVQNNHDVDLSIKLIHKHPPSLFSELKNWRSETYLFHESNLTEQEQRLIQAICEEISGSEVSSLKEQQRVLGGALGITEQDSSNPDTSLFRSSDIVKQVFRFFCRLSDADLPLPDVSMRSKGLDEQHTDLLQVWKTRRGVCRHQCGLVPILLKCFGLESTVHANARHMFLVMRSESEKNIILNMDYFSSSAHQEQYQLLEQRVSVWRDKFEPNLSKEVNTALLAANKILSIDRVSDIPLKDLYRLNIALRERNDAKDDLDRKPAAKTQALSETPPKTSQPKTEQPTQIADTRPEKLIEDLQSNVTAEALPEIIERYPDIPIQQWITACSLAEDSDHQVLLSQNVQEESRAAKRAKMNYDALNHGEANKERIQDLKTQALKSIFLSLIQSVPSGSKTTRIFLPTEFYRSQNIRMKAVELPHGYLIRYESPSTDVNAHICIQPPATFSAPYWLLTANKKPVQIASVEQHEAINRDSLLQISLMDNAVFEQTLHLVRNST